MDVTAIHTSVGDWYAPAAVAALVAILVSGAALLALHLVSPEFGPSWRMVSEYANGHYAWVLTLAFAAWAVGSFALVPALWPLWATPLGKVGLGFLLLAGIGQAMGALFDLNHKLHGPAAMIGIPSLCIAAVILTIALSRRPDIVAPPIWVAHLPWISFVLMLGSFALLFSALKAAGVDMSGQSSPLKELPVGVTGYLGWANRLLFAATYLWVAAVAWAVIKTRNGVS